MRKQKLWAVTTMSALLLLIAAASVLASKKTSQPATQQSETTAPATQSESLVASTSDEPVTIMLQLNSADPGAQITTVADRSATGAGPDDAEPQSLSFLKRLTSMAMGFLGTPYRWGGTTPRAFDCSGFTRYCYAKLGVKLPRTARQQYKAGTVVKSGNLKKGDLIFFDMMKGYVSHVGMYLGNNRFIHAANPRAGVRIDSLGSKTYKKRYVGARRFFS